MIALTMNALTNTVLCTLACSLSGNDLRAEGAKFLSEGLRENTSLKELKYTAIQTSP